MSELSGSLADFSVSAVIRLLAAGDKTGILVIHGSYIGGSVFFDAGEVAFATTRKHHQNGSSPEDDRRDGPPAIGDGMIADVLTRLTRQGTGTFTFQADVQPVHEIKTTFSADHILDLVDERLEVWNEVLESLGSTDEPYAMASDLEPDEEIRLTGTDWNVLSVLGRGRSSTEVAAIARIGELEAAQALVRLKDDGLVEASDLSAPSEMAPSLDGGRLHEPDPDDVVVNITDAAVAAMEADDDGGSDDPVSDLAARWRNLRTASRDELPTP